MSYQLPSTLPFFLFIETRYELWNNAYFFTIFSVTEGMCTGAHGSKKGGVFRTGEKLASSAKATATGEMNKSRDTVTKHSFPFLEEDKRNRRLQK